MIGLMGAEFRKVATAPVLVVFVVLSMTFNGLVLAAASYMAPATKVAASVTRSFGGHIDVAMQAAFAEGATAEQEELLGDAVRTAENVFDGMDAAALGAHYADRVEPSPVAGQLRRKYATLQGRIDHLAQTGVALDLYAGPVTHNLHQTVFGSLMPAVMAEAALIGAATVLLLHEMERVSGMRQTLFSSACGRRVVLVKLVCAMLVALGCYALLMGLVLGIAAVMFDLGPLLGSSVSSQFNFLVEALMVKPFITWGDFTVAGYALAVCGLGVLLVLIACMAASVAALLCRDAYRAALMLALACVAMPAVVDLATRAGLWELVSAAAFLPVNVWLLAYAWFTDLGRLSLVPWHETIALAVDLCVMMALVAVVYRRFLRRDVVA